MNEPKISLALSGGGSRAIAFHLGCLRALQNLGILETVNCISSVSGGSIINCIYSYSNESFEDFEKKVRDILKTGITRGIILELIKPQFLLAVFINYFLFIGSAACIFFIKILLRIFVQHNSSTLKKLNNPIVRKYNRTYAFEKYLNKKIFREQKIDSLTRRNIKVVVNACELKTGTAFRFGNNESGCWRYGKIHNNNLLIATAVAASAAYPILLPAIDRKWQIENREGKVDSKRIFLTDGGVYDNLGVSCLEPGKSEEFSYNTYPSDYIICCNAGQGQFSLDNYPSWWMPRMIKSFQSIFRKVQDSYASKLHIYKNTGLLKGFIYSYLGQQDNRLPFIPDNFITRDIVFNYPTNFSRMKNKDLDNIYMRGYQLTEMLIKHYHSELLNSK